MNGQNPDNNGYGDPETHFVVLIIKSFLCVANNLFVRHLFNFGRNIDAS